MNRIYGVLASGALLLGSSMIPGCSRDYTNRGAPPSGPALVEKAGERRPPKAETAGGWRVINAIEGRDFTGNGIPEMVTAEASDGMRRVRVTEGKGSHQKTLYECTWSAKYAPLYGVSAESCAGRPVIGVGYKDGTDWKDYIGYNRAKSTFMPVNPW
jgi:hypothetical protein